MAIAYGGLIGVDFTKTSGTTLSIVPPATLPASTLIVVRVAADNLSANTPTITVSDNKSNTYSQQYLSSNSATAAAAVVGCISWSVLTAALTTADTITITFSGSIAAKAAYAEYFTGADSAQRGTAVTAVGSGTAPTVTSGTGPLTGDLVLGVVGYENDGTLTGDSDTTNGVWAGLDAYGTSGGNTATNVTAVGQHKIITGNGAQTFNITLGTSGDWTVGIVVLKPAVVATPATISATATLPAPTETATGTASPAVISAVTTLDAPTETSFDNPLAPTLGVETFGTNAIGLTNPQPTITASPSTISALVTLPAPTETATATQTTVTISSVTTLPAPTETVSKTQLTEVVQASVSLLAPTIIRQFVGVWGIDAAIRLTVNATTTPGVIAASVTLPAPTETVVETLNATSNIANAGCTNPNNANGAQDSVFTGNTGDSTWNARWAIGDPSNALSGTQNGVVYWKKDATGGGNPTATLELWENGSLVSTLLNAVSITDATSSSSFSFNASAITNRNNIELRVSATVSGGSPANRRTVQVDAFQITFSQAV